MEPTLRGTCCEDAGATDSLPGTGFSEFKKLKFLGKIG